MNLTRGFFRMKRGQGTFEYVLLLGGVLLIVVLAIVVLQQTAQQGFQGAGQQQCTARLLTDISCRNAQGNFNSCGVVTASTYQGCQFQAGTFTTAAPTGCTNTIDAATQRYCGRAPIGP
ncbi:class III signal peptide-containing protein [Candidatus Micrarchaeota archaeon]|nr:class III signal peptide-containing protein [Candidatus Micrarchaeota archaeon]